MIYSRIYNPGVVIVTGGRAYNRRDVVWASLDFLHHCAAVSLLVTGACEFGGADKHAEDWARWRRIDYRGFPAKKDADGKTLGMPRNERMIDTVYPSRLMFYPGGYGTAGCVTLARDRNILIIDGAHVAARYCGVE